MTRHFRPGDHRSRQIVIPAPQLETDVYGPTNTLVPWGMIATLHSRALTLAKRVGLQFADSFDDVDDLKVALIETPSATLVALVDHLGAPVPATEVHANVADPGAAERLLREVLAALKLSDDEVRWRRLPSD
jgi:hypothetical protein